MNPGYSQFAFSPEHRCCFRDNLNYLARMDWQQAAALGIVGVTAALFVWNKMRPRRFSFERDTHCGCSASAAANPQPSIIFRQRKGERPQILVKMP